MPQDEASGEEANRLFYRVVSHLTRRNPFQASGPQKKLFLFSGLQTADVTAARNGGQVVECSQQLAHHHS